MPAQEFFASEPEAVGLSSAAVATLMERAEREVREGLLPSAQVAIAREGKLAAMRTFGRAVHGDKSQEATNQTLYCVFSCTKAIVASAAWLLLQERRVALSTPVAEIVPEFATNGKESVTVEHLLLHTGGFPNAPYPQSEWNDRRKRLERFKSWHLEWTPGTRYMYHPTSGFWVIAEIIERVTGDDYREFIRRRIAQPLGLSDLRVGAPRELHSAIADVVYVGEPADPEELRRLGLPEIPATEVTEEAILGFNRPEVREAGVPGGGGIMTAGDLALFYQALLADLRGNTAPGIWRPETLGEALRVHSGDLLDPFLRVPCNRGLGVVIAGDDGKANFRGFGKNNSPRAFGHNGAGGQIGWADPVTGISFAYCTNGFDRNPIREGRRTVALGSLAAACAL